MNAQRLVVNGIRQIEVDDIEIGATPDDGLLVQNEFTAVSVGTEIYGWVHGGPPGREAKYPHGTGYCNVGRVLEVGELVDGIQVGDRVAGQGNHASHAILRGLYQKVPEGVSAKSAAFMVMAAIAMHGNRVARIELGEAVVVMGMGIVGQLAATFARLSGGLPVIGVDLDDFRLGKAKTRGLDMCLNPGEIDDLSEVVRSHCEEDGANVVMEATGKPIVYPTAVKLACLGGRMVALGSPRGTVEMDFLTEVHLREVQILGAHQPKTPDGDHIYYRWTKNRDRRLVMRLMAEGKLEIEDLITHTVRPEDCLEMYTQLAVEPQETLGVVFAWN